MGAFAIQLQENSSLNSSTSSLADGREVVLTGHVVKGGILRDEGSSGVNQTINLLTDEIATGDQTFATKIGVRLSVHGKQPRLAAHGDEMKLFHYGERLRVETKLYPPRNYRNPGAFDYAGYLAENGITALGSAKFANISVLPGFMGKKAELWRTRMHRGIIERVHALWSPADAGLVDAMVIGEDSFIHRSTRVNFQKSGTYHLLIVSGMNVSILAFVTFWFLKHLRIGEIAASAITVVLIICYALLTDLGSPVAPR
ncbi:MAG: hypothetical protein NVS1B11_12870 [Terriglobales bacterium]